MGRMRASLTPIGGPITDTHQPMVVFRCHHDAAEQQGLTCSCVAVDDSCPAL